MKPGKIFVNYRRDDERSTAARVRDRLALEFGKSNVFMDVDNLTAGQRFDKELEKALAETNILLAIIGTNWIGLLRKRQASGEPDYVRKEIAEAIKRGIVVIPVLIDTASLPRGDDLPDDIRELVLHQKTTVTHEQFGRDVDGLIEAIKSSAKKNDHGFATGKRQRRVMSLLAMPVLIGAAVAALSCRAEMLEFEMADGFKLSLPAHYSYDEIARQVTIHEDMARKNKIRLRELDAPAIRITGPEGLALFFNPRNTPDLVRRSLLDMYSTEDVDQMMAGRYEGKLSPSARLLLAGRSKEEADALLSLDLKYVSRKAYADALNKAEVDRLLKLTDEKRHPLIDSKPIAGRITEARHAADRQRGVVCRFLAMCGL